VRAAGAHVQERARHPTRCGAPTVLRPLRAHPILLSHLAALPFPRTHDVTGCALCDSVCPSNAGTTLFDTIEALSIDIGNAVRVVGKCFAGGFAGCLCNILLAMKPVWIDQLPSPQERCSGGNVFGLLVSKILEMYAADDQNTSHPFDSRWQHLFTFLWYNLSCLDFALPHPPTTHVRRIMQSQEDVINGFIVDPINAVLGSLPWPLSYLGQILPRVCLTGYWKPGGKCWEGDENLAAYLGCYATERSAAARQCFFTRCATLVEP